MSCAWLGERCLPQFSISHRQAVLGIDRNECPDQSSMAARHTCFFVNHDLAGSKQLPKPQAATIDPALGVAKWRSRMSKESKGMFARAAFAAALSLGILGMDAQACRKLRPGEACVINGGVGPGLDSITHAAGLSKPSGNTCRAVPQALLNELRFAPAGAELLASEQTLQRIVEVWRDQRNCRPTDRPGHPEIHLRVLEETARDETGSDGLSAERASSLLQSLVKAGVPPTQIRLRVSPSRGGSSSLKN